MDIAILGAGVAGLTSAITLKLKGFNVQVYERHLSLANIGAGIVLWPNATFVLQQIGLLDEVKALSGNLNRMQRFSSEGENLGTLDIELLSRHMGHPSYSILRRDLQALLLAKSKVLGIPVHYAHQVTAIETNTDSSAVVRFAAGSKITADVVIGADGRMKSFAREYVHGDNIPVYQRFINWIGVVESQQEIFADCAVRDYWGVGSRFGIVPVTPYKAYWAGGTAANEIDSRNKSQYKQELNALFCNWPKPVVQMIEQSQTELINKIYVHDHEPIQCWHRNNLIIIGDAAHAALPTSGQGACQAIEDAWHLANCLVENESNLEQAFEQFTSIRLAKTNGITSGARGLAFSLFNTDANYCKVRNENSKQTDYVAVAAGMAKGWAQNLPLMVS